MQHITQYDSQNVGFRRLLETDQQLSVTCIYLGVDGNLGTHEAAQDQLFLVVAGRGWVRVGDDKPIRIEANQAAFWQAGELHESGSHNGTVAIVIEGENLQPEKFMEEIVDGQNGTPRILP